MKTIYTRGSDGRGGFNRVGRMKAALMASDNVPLSKITKIARAADMTKAKVEAHTAKHRATWVNKRYGDLLANGGSTRTLAPGWSANDPTAALRTRAQNEVKAKHESRLARVERAQTNMLKTGRIRETRKMDWGRGLGD